jgi:hypothetical protein
MSCPSDGAILRIQQCMPSSGIKSPRPGLFGSILSTNLPSIFLRTSLFANQFFCDPIHQELVMATEVTVEVDHYRPVDGDGLLLQSPVSPNRIPGDVILTREDRGANKDNIRFRPICSVDRISSGHHRAYAHGVLIKSSPDGRHRQGDRVWLLETARRDRAVPLLNCNTIDVANLRTQERINVALRDVCWIPTSRMLDHGVNEEVLVTISGSVVRRRDRKEYRLAIVQRLRLKNGTMSVEGVGLRELVEKEVCFKYKNLTALPDGERQISEFFRQSLASVAPALLGLDSQRPTPNLGDAVVPSQNILSSATPSPEEESDGGSGGSTPRASLSPLLTGGPMGGGLMRNIEEAQRSAEAREAEEGVPRIPAIQVGQPTLGPICERTKSEAAQADEQAPDIRHQKTCATSGSFAPRITRSCSRETGRTSVTHTHDITTDQTRSVSRARVTTATASSGS